MANEARNASLRRQSRPTKAITLLSAINTTGAGGQYGLGGPYANFGILAFRASTGSSGASTKVNYRLEGNIDNSTSLWAVLGASTRSITVKSSAAVLTAYASTQGPVTSIRARLKSFTTSASTTQPDKVKFTLKVIPYT